MKEKDKLKQKLGEAWAEIGRTKRQRDDLRDALILLCEEFESVVNLNTNAPHSADDHYQFVDAKKLIKSMEL